MSDEVSSVETENNQPKYFSNMARPGYEPFNEDELVKFVHLSGEEVKKWAESRGVGDIDKDILERGVVLLDYGEIEHRAILCEALGLDYHDLFKRNRVQNLLDEVRPVNAGLVTNFDELRVGGSSPNLRDSKGRNFNDIMKSMPDEKRVLDSTTRDLLNRIYKGKYTFRVEGWSKK